MVWSTLGPKRYFSSVDRCLMVKWMDACKTDATGAICCRMILRWPGLVYRERTDHQMYWQLFININVNICSREI